MKNTTMKNTIMMAALLVATGHAGLVSAHDSGTRSLGTAIGATDLYQVNCSDDGTGNADHLFFQLQDLAPVAAPVISAQVLKYPRAANTTDQVDGNAALSPTIKLKGGNGTYFIIVDKSKAGGELYKFNYHCETAGNGETGTELLVIQNQ